MEYLKYSTLKGKAGPKSKKPDTKKVMNEAQQISELVSLIQVIIHTL